MKTDNSSLLEAGANCSCTQVSHEPDGNKSYECQIDTPLTSVISTSFISYPPAGVFPNKTKVKKWENLKVKIYK